MTRGSDIQAVLRAGHRRRTPRLDFAWRPNEATHARLGVVVPRHGCSAVARNRLRRRLREVARRDLLPQLSPIDLVIWARPSAYRVNRTELVSDLTSWLHSLAG